MANNLGVWFEPTKLPTIAAWERAASELGFRLRVDPADLREQSGVLSVAVNSDEMNSGFEFEVRSDCRYYGDPALIGGRSAMACFKCFNDSLPETVWAAVAFARACGGLFSDDCGSTRPTLEDAIDFARERAPLVDAKGGRR